MKRDLAACLLLAAMPALAYAALCAAAARLPSLAPLIVAAAVMLSGLLAWRLRRTERPDANQHLAATLEGAAGTSSTGRHDILLRTEKLASLGRLAGGVAHELNNPLTAIMGEATILRQRCTQPELSRGLQVIEQQAARCAGLVRDLVAFASLEQRQVQPLDVQALLEGALAQAALAAPAQEVTVVRQYAAEPLTVSGNMEQLQQALGNVLGNAYQAMAGGPPGRLTLRTQRAAGAMARLEIADSGVGIEPASLPYVFDPFYSRRAAPLGQGVGLGLSVALGVVRAHGGKIWVESEPGQGTTVFIELPCSASAGMDEDSPFR